MRNQMISVDHKRQYCANCADTNMDVKQQIEEAFDRKKLVISNDSLDMIDKPCTCCGELLTTIAVSTHPYEVQAAITLTHTVELEAQSETEARYTLLESVRNITYYNPIETGLQRQLGLPHCYGESHEYKIQTITKVIKNELDLLFGPKARM